MNILSRLHTGSSHLPGETYACLADDGFWTVTVAHGGEDGLLQRWRIA